MTATCTICGDSNPFTAAFFAKDGNRLRRQCRHCRAASKRSQRVRRETDDPSIRERRLLKARETSATWKRSNRAHCVQSNKAWAERTGYYKQYYLDNQEEIRARAAAWRLANPTRKLENNRKWAAANPEKHIVSMRTSKRKRRQRGDVRLCESVSAEINFALKHRKDGRSWEALVGYTRKALTDHIARQFVRGMSWSNYGTEWQIDHIVPIARFNFHDATDDEFRACWALTNLRPLWATSNREKRDKRLFLI